MENFIKLEGKCNKDCIIYNNDVEAEALAQIYKIMDSHCFENVPIRIMPDVHSGNGIVIGFSAPLTDMINPSYVGVDIGCSVSMCITDKDINKEEIPIIEHKIKKEIPMGFDINSYRVFEMKDFFKFIKNEYNKARSSWGDMINDIEISEKGILKMLMRIGMDEGLFYKSIGTIGGGNHFIELGNLNGKYTFAIHCGSRNFGLKICKYWENVASTYKIDNKAYKDEIEKIKLNTPNKSEISTKIVELKERMVNELPPIGFLDGGNMRGYITDMVLAQAYAKYNHHIIIKRISDILKKINGAKVVETIQSVHNYIDINDRIIRKGAIRAYKNEKMLVPFNMRDGIAICEGKSNPEWNYTCSHGSGRKMSRGKAKRNLSMEEFRNTMDGIYSTSVSYDTIDESPMAYKETNSIINLISDTCTIIDVVKPIINIKSSNTFNFD